MRPTPRSRRCGPACVSTRWLHAARDGRRLRPDPHGPRRRTGHHRHSRPSRTHRETRRPGDWKQVRLLGGGALIFDEFGRLKYHIHNAVLIRRSRRTGCAICFSPAFSIAPERRRDQLRGAAHARPAENEPSRSQEGVAMAVASPQALTLRCYGVGFGDCFLLTFHYAGTTGDRHMLIDFGSTQHPPNAQMNLIGRIANDIAGSLARNFTCWSPRIAMPITSTVLRRTRNGDGTGDRIAALDPQLVIQPWTEDPKAARRHRHWFWVRRRTSTRRNKRCASPRAAADACRRRRQPARVARAAADAAEAGRGRDLVHWTEGLSNMSAVKNLAAMGAKKTSAAAYVHAGCASPRCARCCPASRSMLGRRRSIRRRTSPSSAGKTRRVLAACLYRFHALLETPRRHRRAHSGSHGAPSPLFPNAATQTLDTIPIEDRWFVRRVRNIRGRQLLGLVRTMDDALNNTSVILLIRAGSARLLFPATRSGRTGNTRCELRRGLARSTSTKSAITAVSTRRRRRCGTASRRSRHAREMPPA